MQVSNLSFLKHFTDSRSVCFQECNVVETGSCINIRFISVILQTLSNQSYLKMLQMENYKPGTLYWNTRQEIRSV